MSEMLEGILITRERERERNKWKPFFLRLGLVWKSRLLLECKVQVHGLQMSLNAKRLLNRRVRNFNLETNTVGGLK